MIRNHEIPPEVALVISSSAALHGVSAGMVLSKNRERPVVAARRTAIRILRDQPYAFSFPEIGRFLGKRHHTSVMHLFHSEAPQRRSIGRLPPCSSVVQGVESDILFRLKEIESHRKVLIDRMAELASIEGELTGVLARLKTAKEQTA